MPHNPLRETIARNAIAFLQENLSRSITTSELSASLGYCDRHLRRIFKEVTGKGILQCLLELRIEKAKRLLRDTDLRITEIAFNCGFCDSIYFSKVFHKAEGLSPTAFRTGARRTGQVPVATSKSGRTALKEEWFQDLFAGAATGEWWKIQNGKMERGNGYIQIAGNAPSLGFDKHLPENFRISLDMYFLREQGLEPADFRISLTDEKFQKTYCSVEVGAVGNTMGKISRTPPGAWQLGTQWNPQAVFKAETWHRVDLEFKEDTVEFSLDGVGLFLFRDPFPPSFSSRCKFTVGSWLSTFRVRNLKISDLGFTPFVRTIRQGDMLYNEGLWVRAQEFYTRHLDSPLSPADSIELNYKIGMCLLQQGYYVQASAALEKVVALPDTLFWAQTAAVANLEICWKSGDVDSLLREIRRLWNSPACRNGIREIIERAYVDYHDRGFIDHAGRLEELLGELEEKSSHLRRLALQLAADSFLERRSYHKAIATVSELMQISNVSNRLQEFSLLTLADAYSHLGRFAESEAALNQARSNTSMANERLRYDLLSAANLRGREQFEEAVRLLEKIAEKGTDNTLALRAFAHVQKIFILCGLGRMDEAQKTIADADALQPGYGTGSGQPVMEIIKGNYAHSSDLLLSQSRQDGAPATQAPLAIKAGILFELSGDKGKAQEIWREAIRRFPISFCCYYASLAESLLTGAKGVLEKMPFSLFAWCEMLYLGGLLYESRGEKEYARSLFELIVKEDPTRRWPTVLAAKKLEA